MLDLPEEVLGAGAIPYLIVGRGPVPFVILPGTNEGLGLVTDNPRLLAWRYRQRAVGCRLLFVSRRFPLPPGYSLQRHADDVAWAMQQLNWEPSIWEVNSVGGPIGQWAAVQHPALVKGLILSNTMHRAHTHTRQIWEDWIQLAQNEDWQSLAWSIILYTRRPKDAARMRPFRSFVTRPGNQIQDSQRMVYLLQELLELDNRAILPDILVPTVVLGGQNDRIIPAEVQREMSALITNSRLKLFPGYGHANDQENPAYEVEVDKFVQRVYTAS